MGGSSDQESQSTPRSSTACSSPRSITGLQPTMATYGGLLLVMLLVLAAGPWTVTSVSADSLTEIMSDSITDLQSASVLEVGSQSVSQSGRTKRTSGVFCGNNLPKVFMMVCKGMYNKRKRFSSPYLGGVRGGVVGDRLDELHEMELPSEEALRFMGPVNVRVRRGAYDECCSKSCTLSEILTYCSA